jgi:tetratricopeptide (TPR) repeat protein
MADRLRISRKQLLKDPDQFLTVGDRALRFYQDHGATVGWFTAGIALVFVVFLVLSGYLGQRRHAMENLVSRMEKTINDDKLGEDVRVAELKKNFSELGEGEQKQRARLLLADYHFRQNQIDAAVALLEETKGKSRPGDLHYELAQVSLAGTLSANKDFKKAIEVYKRIIAESKSLPIYTVYLDLARCYEQDNNVKDALLVLREAQNKFPGHTSQEKVQAWIQKLEARA